MNAGCIMKTFRRSVFTLKTASKSPLCKQGRGDGNFFMKPNGVFGTPPEGLPFVLTTEAYALLNPPVSFATQSGPMLVIDGAIHSRSNRTALHVTPATASASTVRAVSSSPSRGELSASESSRACCNDPLQCKNALYFDGVVSALSGNDLIIEGGGYPAGPILAVFEK